MKLGLVLEGGASRAYFSCGVIDEMLKNNIIADYVIGTSAGIADGVSYCSGQIGRNYKIATQFLPDKRYMGLKHLINPKNRSYYNLDFVFDEIPNKHLLFDYKAFSEFKGEVVATVTNVKTGKTEYLNVPRDDKTFQILRATCALPLLFPKIKINGKQYMDGGITNSIPVEQAINNGCEKTIVVLTQPRGYIKGKDKTLEFSAKLYKKNKAFAQALLNRSEVYNNNLANVFELEKQNKVFIIEPNASLGVSRTENNPEKLSYIHKLGEQRFYELLPKLKDFLSEQNKATANTSNAIL